MTVAYTLERVDSCWNDLCVLAQDLHPSFTRYQACNDAGVLQVMTARAEGHLIGFATLYLSQSMTDQHWMASVDRVVLVPAHEAWTGMLLKAVEDQCQRWGVAEILVGVDGETWPSSILGQAVIDLDYHPKTVQYSKQIPPCADSAHRSEQNEVVGADTPTDPDTHH